ncbi:hypothetical protein [Yinghuangia seranimata]|uniref:hypothetical protein n=1 Tax=Yinghuangia seranimata TaxID=408067 RepID=UPI00248C62A4|nr:hypothetical protein [Yinghuangia seranimata]MDI2130385.1 hypothetical protein [Yinghuangia seranimata]
MDRDTLSALLGSLATRHALEAKHALDAGAHFEFQATADPVGYFVSMWELRIEMAAERGDTLQGVGDAVEALTSYIPGHVCGGFIRNERQRFLYWLTADQSAAVHEPSLLVDDPRP